MIIVLNLVAGLLLAGLLGAHLLPKSWEISLIVPYLFLCTVLLIKFIKGKGNRVRVLLLALLILGTTPFGMLGTYHAGKAYQLKIDRDIQKQQAAIKRDLKLAMDAVNKGDVKGAKVYLEDERMEGNSQAQFLLGHIYVWREKKFEKGTGLLMKSAEAGHRDGLYYLARRHINSEFPGFDLSKGIELFEKSIQRFNDSRSAYYLGELYLMGAGVVRNDALGFQLIRRAAFDSNLDSQKRLVKLYELGRGIPVDLKKAKNWQRWIEKSPGQQRLDRHNGYFPSDNGKW